MSDLARELLRKPAIVRIQKGDVLAVCALQPGVPQLGRIAAVLESDYVEPVVFHRSQIDVSAVRGAVIDDDQLAHAQDVCGFVWSCSCYGKRHHRSEKRASGQIRDIDSSFHRFSIYRTFLRSL